ncbi:peptidoglycan-binding domain-containing protein [Streptomyces parvus]|uniref:Peptidoglycan-binding domain-containing protein n=1 Tax=Streptomyces sp. JL1001 TaxID=3078227 RepID=A0AAU8KK36_9ACTN|nr:peptidoglycan-binding domain-containing protein [Streptomyces sp. Termitarium-T10T-6]SCD90414.1 Putative peptidoglycan binding domain-containing protein [Streptomyces sp. Termitarium-T10T-6]
MKTPMRTHRNLTALAAGTALALVPLTATTAQAAPATGTSVTAAAAFNCSIRKVNDYWYAGWYAGMTAVPAAGRVTDQGIEAQCLLKDAGYYRGAIDGYFGPQSQDAMKRYQRLINQQHGVGLVVDGWPGPKSWPWLRR